MHDHLKTVVITGGTKGIGAAIAEHFYHHGYAVVVCGRADNGFIRRQLGRGAFFVKTDVSKLAQVRALMAKAVRLTGSVDAVVNCAGFSQWKTLNTIDNKFLQKMLDINLKGVFWSCQAALPYLKPGASIVNVASLAGKRGSANNSAYCAAKFAVVGLTQALAKELGPQGIRVNALCPVYVLTDGVLKALQEKSSPTAGKNIQAYLKQFTLSHTALKRLPTAGEVAQACLFLVSPAASAITGQSLNVDCGVFPQ